MKRPVWMLVLLLGACQRAENPRPEGPHDPSAQARDPANAPPSTSGTSGTAAVAPGPPGAAATKVDVSETAMGTQIHVIAYTNARVDEARAREAIGKAVTEIRRLEDLMTTWRPSELTRVNDHAGEFVEIGPDNVDVLKKSLWASKISEGTFDITFASMGKLWKFGDAQDKNPAPPNAKEVEKKRKLIDYRKIDLDEPNHRVKIGKDQKIDVGGIAKGYAVDAAARVLRAAGLDSFLMQAGGDLYGAGKKPDGSPWVSGIRDPRGGPDSFFATIELTDHAFSTAGDYARSYMVGGKRYHHIIDPRTGYPATESRSVTIWALDAFTADAIDDAVFILGPTKGLELCESIDGVGAVIVDSHNQTHVSKRLVDAVKITRKPTDAP